MKNKLEVHEDFIEALYELNEKVNKDFGKYIPATYFEPVIKAHSKVVKEINKSKILVEGK
jgi:hypothetical protein